MNRVFIVVIAVFPLLLATGCATNRSGMGLKLPPVPPLQLTARPAHLEAEPPRPIFPWLVVSEFYPPGCKPIFSRWSQDLPKLVETPRAWFPSVAECIAPRGERTLYHLGAEGGGGMDYVVFVRQRPAETARAVFQIRKALEVLWSPDGRCVAITVLTGNNNAAVVLLRMDDLKPTEPIPTAEALRGYLTPVQIDAPQFVMALRWTDAGQLVLRARGQEPLAPYTLFGYELLVDTDHLIDPAAVHFLRGYTKAAQMGEAAKSG